MQMRTSRWLKSCTAAMLAAVMLAGCGSGGTTATTAAAGGAAGAEEKGEEVTIRVMIWDRGDAAPGTTVENNALTDWIKAQMKEKYNINVEYVSVPRASSDDKVNIMMTGGNAPDIVFTYSQNLFNSFAQNGGLADLGTAYDTYGGDIEQYLGEAQEIGLVDGTRYAVMKQRGIEACRHTAYIRQDWLDALGMERPKTKEELFAYLEAVKEKNPGGVSNVIPWGMSGKMDTEMHYVNFVGSYVDLSTEKDAYVYSEQYMAVAPGSIDGLRKLNELYNKGLITKDFATDTTEDIFKAQVSSGNVGFLLYDTEKVWDYISVLTQQEGKDTFVPVSCFDLADGSYRNPFEQRYGMFLMIPKASEAKLDACMKYLNWQADPEVAENIAYTPDHERDELGVPIKATTEVFHASKYPGTPDDYNIVNLGFAFTSDRTAVIGKWNKEQEVWGNLAWFENYYNVRNEGKYRFPVYSNISQEESDYGKNVQDLMIEYVYKVISCPTDSFDATQQAEYGKLVSAGMQKILDARAAYYDSVN